MWMQDNPMNVLKSIVKEDSRESLTRVTIECARLSLEKWSLEEGWIL